MWIPIAMTICLASSMTGDVDCSWYDGDWPPVESPTEHICEARMRVIYVDILAELNEQGILMPLVSLTPECREKVEHPA